MNKKLTLTIEESVIEKAKRYSKNHKRSLSGLIENYLKFLTREEPEGKNELAPTVKSLKGSFKMPKDFDYKKVLSEELAKKHL